MLMGVSFGATLYQSTVRQRFGQQGQKSLKDLKEELREQLKREQATQTKGGIGDDKWISLCGGIVPQ